MTAIPLGRALLRASSNQPGRQGTETRPCPLAQAASSLFGFAPGGACHAVPVAGSAVRSYRTFSPLPCRKSRSSPAQGGSISVALSLGSPPPDVIRHRVSVEPGLSSLASESGRPADWRGGDARWRARRQGRKAVGNRALILRSSQRLRLEGCSSGLRSLLKRPSRRHSFGMAPQDEGSHDEKRALHTGRQLRAVMVRTLAQ